MRVRKVTAEYEELNTLSKLVFIANDFLKGRAVRIVDGKLQVSKYHFRINSDKPPEVIQG